MKYQIICSSNNIKKYLGILKEYNLEEIRIEEKWIFDKKAKIYKEYYITLKNLDELNNLLIKLNIIDENITIIYNTDLLEIYDTYREI